MVFCFFWMKILVTINLGGNFCLKNTLVTVNDLFNQARCLEGADFNNAFMSCLRNLDTHVCFKEGFSVGG